MSSALWTSIQGNLAQLVNHIPQSLAMLGRVNGVHRKIEQKQQNNEGLSQKAGNKLTCIYQESIDKLQTESE